MPIVNLWTGELREQKKEEFFKNTFPPKLAALVKILGRYLQEFGKIDEIEEVQV